MTQKELLYCEDAIGHEKSIIKICEGSIKNLEDENLINFMNEEINRHNKVLDSLINKLEGETNE